LFIVQEGVVVAIPTALPPRDFSSSADRVRLAASLKTPGYKRRGVGRLVLAGRGEKDRRNTASAERAPTLAEERRRGGSDPSPMAVRVLNRQHDRLHAQAESGTEHGHEQVGVHEGRVGTDGRQRSRPTDEQDAATTGSLVAAVRAVSCPAVSEAIIMPATSAAPAVRPWSGTRLDDLQVQRIDHSAYIRCR